jgi:hypothetical protein
MAASASKLLQNLQHTIIKDLLSEAQCRRGTVSISRYRCQRLTAETSRQAESLDPYEHSRRDSYDAAGGFQHGLSLRRGSCANHVEERRLKLAYC